MSENVKVTESCGCVFCDLALDPDNEIDGRPVHMHKHKGAGYGTGVGYSFCTNDALQPAPSPTEE